MAIPQQELPNHDRFGLLPRREPKQVEALKVYKPDPVCACGCGKKVEVVEYRTHEGEAVASESCFMRIAYAEGWLKRVG